jgi:hypothetical protein
MRDMIDVYKIKKGEVVKLGYIKLDLLYVENC